MIPLIALAALATTKIGLYFEEICCKSEGSQSETDKKTDKIASKVVKKEKPPQKTAEELAEERRIQDVRATERLKIQRIERAKQTLIDHFVQSQPDGGLAPKEHPGPLTEEIVTALRKASNQLPHKEMKLHHQPWGRYGFPYRFGEIKGKAELIPLNWEEGYVLLQFLREHPDGRDLPQFPIKDPIDGQYFVPDLSGLVEHRGASSGSASMSDHFHNLLREASMARPTERTSNLAFRTLEMLAVQYKESVKDYLGTTSFTRLQQLIPAYAD